MNTGEQVNIFIDGKEISTITGYKFLRALITNYGYTKDEIKKIIRLCKQQWQNWQNHDTQEF
jgi:predicted Mrr-cat superfamily restriction endonuclease